MVNKFKSHVYMREKKLESMLINTIKNVINKAIF